MLISYDSIKNIHNLSYYNLQKFIRNSKKQWLLNKILKFIFLLKFTFCEKIQICNWLSIIKNKRNNVKNKKIN